MTGMRTKRRNGGRPRTRERVAKVYVGGYVDDEIADTLDDICDAIGQSRSQIIGDMVRAYVESNVHRAAPQHQEALIAS